MSISNLQKVIPKFDDSTYMAALYSVWPDRAILKDMGDKFSYARSPNI